MDRQLVEQLANSIMQGMQALADAQQQSAQQISQTQANSIAQLTEQLTRPKEVIRGADGKIIGVQ